MIIICTCSLLWERVCMYGLSWACPIEHRPDVVVSIQRISVFPKKYNNHIAEVSSANLLFCNPQQKNFSSNKLILPSRSWGIKCSRIKINLPKIALVNLSLPVQSGSITTGKDQFENYLSKSCYIREGGGLPESNSGFGKEINSI